MRFIGLGAQRAGTTWLWRVLQSHPQVAYSPIKELHYFDVKHDESLAPAHYAHVQRQLIHHTEGLTPRSPAHAQMRLRMLAHWLTMRSDEDYLDYFSAVERFTGKRCVGEITPSYALLAGEGFSDILRVMPEAKLFFIMRNPVARVWSNACMNGNAPKDLLTFAKRPPVQLRTDYRRTVTALRERVPPERVHVAFYEDLSDSANGQEHLSRLFAHLGLDPYEVPEEVLSGRGKGDRPEPLEATERRELAALFVDAYTFARELMGYLPAAWERDLAALG